MCRLDLAKDNAEVKIGTLSLITPDPDEQNIRILSVLSHESFNTTNKLNDIALINVRTFDHFVLITMSRSSVYKHVACKSDKLKPQ